MASAPASPRIDSLPETVAVKKFDGNINKVLHILYSSLLKSINFSFYDFSSKDERLKREVSFLEKSDHPNIVKYYGYFPVDDETTGVVMEICQGTLKNIVKARDLSPFEVAWLSHQMLKGVAYLHDELLIHHRYIRYTGYNNFMEKIKRN